MSKKYSLIIAFAGMMLTTSAFAQAVSTSIDGVWQQEDGSTTVRIAPCSGSTNRCATVTEERLPLPNNIPSSVNTIIVKDLKPNGKNRWKGIYIDGKDSFAATAKLTTPTSVEFRACVVLMLCQTLKYKRIGD